MDSLSFVNAEVFHTNHLGIVAQYLFNIKLADKIDYFLPPSKSVISHVQRACAMILNGLGFVHRTLYLSPEFFKKKPLFKLLGKHIHSDQLNDDSLGRTLDVFYNYGLSRLFSEVALSIVSAERMLGTVFRLDSTSFSHTGQYGSHQENNDSSQKNKTLHVDIDFGYSKDHRPDLKQIMLALVTAGPADIPIFMIPESGNTSDKSTFYKIIEERVKALRGQFDIPEMIWCADSALYGKKWLHIQKELNVLWVTRAPETLKCVKEAIAQACEIPKEKWDKHVFKKDLHPKINIAAKKKTNKDKKDDEKSYFFHETVVNYGTVEQRFVIIFSCQAYKRESLTFAKKLEKERKRISSSLKKIAKKPQSSEQVGVNAIAEIQKKTKLFVLNNIRVSTTPKWKGKGRPSLNSPPDYYQYYVTATLEDNEEAQKNILNRKGIFVLATNDLREDKDKVDCVSLFKLYKGLQGTERGFRFLKDPVFMAHHLFLKKTERIEALLMIMTLTLMVHNIIQHKIDISFKENELFIPNQRGEKTQHITARRLYQMFQEVTHIASKQKDGDWRFYFKGLEDIHKEILRCLGKEFENMYLGER